MAQSKTFIVVAHTPAGSGPVRFRDGLPYLSPRPKHFTNFYHARAFVLVARQRYSELYRKLKKYNLIRPNDAGIKLEIREVRRRA